jgi:hypothetical protein
MRMLLAIGLVLGVLSASEAAAPDTSRCAYKSVFYASGSTTCQSGSQWKCDMGTWKPTGTTCAGDSGDPNGEESQPGVTAPRVREPHVVDPGAGGVPTPRVPPVGQ